MAGLAVRRKTGGGGGRKSVLPPRKRDMAVKLLAAGDRPQDVAEAIGVSVSTFYRYFPASSRVPAADDK